MPTARLERAATYGALALGGALAFCVQPLLGRALLPAYGGAGAVWLTTLLFFQSALVLAQLVAYALARWAPARWPRRAALALVALALLWHLRDPTALVRVALEPTHADLAAPTSALLRTLAERVGLLYVAVTGASLLLLRWHTARAPRAQGAPYAASNAGALLGLLAYPLALEPLLSLRTQALLVTAALGGYALALALALRGAPPAREPPLTSAAPTPAREPAPSRVAWWLALSAGSSALLSTLSTHLTTDIAPGPLWWTLPLALYLLTWVLAFAPTERGRSPRALEAAGLGWLLATVALGVLLAPGVGAPLGLSVAVPLVALFCGALRCHALLAGPHRPPGAGPELVAFYLCISMGGAFGAGLVTALAPRVFTERHELPLTLLALHALFALDARRAAQASRGNDNARRLAWLGLGVAVPVLAGALYVDANGLGRGGVVRARARSFYGPVYVLDAPRARLLRHGGTTHGLERRDEASASAAPRPGAYYGEDTAFARALAGASNGARPARTLGVVGLGVGSAAAYARAGDTLRFFELDAAVAQLARAHFRFLAQSPARVDVVLGDGRAALQREHARGAPRYDVLVLDAFQSDAVPTHLLTREAFALYAQRLAPDGVLLVHASNRHLALERVVVGAARAAGLACRVLETPALRSRGETRARWAALARDEALLAPLQGPSATAITVRAPVRWSDERASVLPLLLGGGP